MVSAKDGARDNVNKEGVVFKVTKVTKGTGWVYVTAVGVLVEGELKSDAGTVKNLNSMNEKHVNEKDYKFHLVSKQVVAFLLCHFICKQ